MKKILIMVGMLIACSMAGTLKDNRDGKTYKTVKIGNQVWMAENLNYKTKESVCYDNKESNCKKYGRLYTWKEAKKVCPAGWHLPTKKERETLLKNVGGEEIAGRALKSRHGWNDDGNGFDNYGFSALPAGRRYGYGNFVNAGYSAYFWSTSQLEITTNIAYGMELRYISEFAYVYDGNKNDGNSVRCLQNSNEERDASLVRPSEAGAANKQNQGSMKDSRDGKTYKTVKIGNQVWMAENLNYEADRSFCYHNKESNCKEDGRLYTWKEAKMVCPAGWHLPTKEEWEILLKNVGGEETAGRALKSRRAWGWKDEDDDIGYDIGFDHYGFSALPVGRRDYDRNFYDAGIHAYFWSASETDSVYAYFMYLDYFREAAFLVGPRPKLRKNNAFSVRCLQNSNEEREASLVRPSEAGAANKQNQGSMKDSRDGKTYKTVKIGNQTWMAENLNYKTSGSMCYDNKESNCKKYGRLYTWKEAKKACPTGWLLPGITEFQKLIDFTGGSKALRTKFGWENENGLDTYGFSALPAGLRYDSGTFYDAGYYASFWSSSENSSRRAYNMNLYYYDEGAYVSDYYDESYGFSVRCFQNSNEEYKATLVRPSEAGAATEQNQGSMKDSRDGKTYKTIKIGDQEWMAENLNYEVDGSVCYSHKDANCKKYGRLYTWGEALDACPAGWRLPSKGELESLLVIMGIPGKGRYAGFEYHVDSSRHLRVDSWENGSDKFGFSAFPAGYCVGINDSYDLGRSTSFWSSTVGHGNHDAYSLNVDDNLANVHSRSRYVSSSVRCLRDSNEGSEVSSSQSEAQPLSGTLKDERDGKIYKTVKIGNQVWMAENLNVETPEGSWCYDNNPEKCEKKYGRLYTWNAAMNACPSGWHLPSDKEWKILISAVGDTADAAAKLRSIRGWVDKGEGSDTFGFAVLAAGSHSIYGNFEDRLSSAYFWSSTEHGSYSAYHWFFDRRLFDYGGYGNHTGGYEINKGFGFSVRCLQNSNEERDASLVRPSEAGAANKQNQGSVKDSRDGKTYKTVKIGDQVWMAENLNYKTSGSVCYDYKDANCKKYGRLYTWGGAQNACPAGWHLPTEEEWGTLLKNVGGKETADRALKSRHGWNDDGNGFDNYGFSALPAGHRDDLGGFGSAGDYAYFWSASELSSYYAYYMNLDYDYEYANVYYYSKYYGYSVRCLQNSNEERDASLVRPSEAGAANKQNQGSVKDSRDGKTYKTVKIGDQVWMAENLNVKIDEGSWCYENKPENCERYGRLYDWATAMDLPAFCNKTCEITVEYPHQGICPKGYHVPTREELETLMDAVGGSSVAGSKLKSTSDWSNRGDGTDVYGFSALPAGDGFSGDIFYDVADSAIFWSASGTFTHYAYTMGFGNGETGNVSYNARLRAFSIRCLKDSNPGKGDESSEEDSEE